ncbi:MAG: hypothetical protein IVW55_12205 [Chloroflexi bacterium]|nr:hypothetical protein [Chloroflexota bacterium]
MTQRDMDDLRAYGGATPVPASRAVVPVGDTGVTPLATTNSTADGDGGGDGDGDKPTPKEPSASWRDRLRERIGDILPDFMAQSRSVGSYAARIPTPGGLSALTATLVLLVSAVVPVNAGYTRLQLLWLTLTGKTSLPEERTSTGVVPLQPGSVVQDSAPTGAVAAPAAPPTSGPRSASYGAF